MATNRSFSSLSVIKINQSILVIFRQKYQGYSLTFYISSLFNLQSRSINFNFVIFRQDTKVIALLFRSFSSLFNLQSKSINFNFGHLSAKYQGYSLTFWPQIAHFHHFSICNHDQSISIFVIFRQNTKVIALLFGRKSLIFITFQSAIKNNQFQFWSFFGKIQGYSLTFWPKIHYSFSIAIKVNFLSRWQNTKALTFWQLRSFSSLFNLQSRSINFNFGHFSAKYQGYSLTFWPQIAHFHHCLICNHESI